MSELEQYEEKTFDSELGLRKTEWGPGPWELEPDLVQWVDEITQRHCIAVRNSMGSWCGYVAVGPSHPYYEKPYEDIENNIDVHGGITFAGPCSDNGKKPGLGGLHWNPHFCDGNHLYWFGFDCSHGGDVIPSMLKLGSVYPSIWSEGVYRDLEYVIEQCTMLAKQLEEASKTYE